MTTTDNRVSAEAATLDDVLHSIRNRRTATATETALSIFAKACPETRKQIPFVLRGWRDAFLAMDMRSEADGVLIVQHAIAKATGEARTQPAADPDATKLAIYDAELGPLVNQILELSRRHKIAIVIAVEIDKPADPDLVRLVSSGNIGPETEPCSKLLMIASLVRG